MTAATANEDSRAASAYIFAGDSAMLGCNDDMTEGCGLKALDTLGGEE